MSTISSESTLLGMDKFKLLYSTFGAALLINSFFVSVLGLGWYVVVIPFFIFDLLYNLIVFPSGLFYFFNKQAGNFVQVDQILMGWFIYIMFFLLGYSTKRHFTFIYVYIFIIVLLVLNIAGNYQSFPPFHMID